jgi:hypothetical protein
MVDFPDTNIDIIIPDGNYVTTDFISAMNNYFTHVGRGLQYLYFDIDNVTAHYIRYPKEPKWTYNSVGGDPLFNPSALDYQDFELPMSDFSDLVVKILQYAGVSIREQEVIAAAKAEELQEIQQKQ